jgi:hypothetical protein
MTWLVKTFQIGRGLWLDARACGWLTLDEQRANGQRPMARNNQRQPATSTSRQLPAFGLPSTLD